MRVGEIETARSPAVAYHSLRPLDNEGGMERKTLLALRVAALEGIWTSLTNSTRLGSKPLLSQSTRVMKLDATDLRYITSDEFRVLTAV